MQHREADVIYRYFGNCRSVLLGAAGGGREIVALAQRGIHVDAFECCQDLVASSRQLLDSINVDSSIQWAEPNTVPESLGTYDGLILGWGAYMDTPSRSRRIRFLTDFHKHLRSGGPLLLSFYTRGGDSIGYRPAVGVANCVCFALRSNRRELGDRFNRGYLHYFVEGEVRHELESAGFELVDYSEQDYGHAVAVVKQF